MYICSTLTDITLFSQRIFYCFLFIFLILFFILLYNAVLILPYIDMNPPQVYMSSQSYTPLPPLSPYHFSL